MVVSFFVIVSAELQSSKIQFQSDLKLARREGTGEGAEA
jgi:hypothetical protein